MTDPDPRERFPDTGPEASGLQGGGGLIERPERLVIVLAGAGLSDFPLFPVPMLLPIAMWLLAVTSLVTVGQRVHSVRSSQGAMDKIEPAVGPGDTEPGDTEP